MTRPLATLRLQFHKHFTFADALQHVDYFATLGISHLYASPITTAQPGSTHGYDTVDYTHVNPELGGEDGLRKLVAALRQRNMGLIADIVPNHMGVGGSANAWWRDILEWGRHASHARFFDVDWHSPDPALRGKVLAPFLGEAYGEALDSGKLSVVLNADEGRFYIAYYDHRFPVCPVDYPMVLSQSASASLHAIAARFADLTSQPEDHVRAAAAQQALAAYAMMSEGQQAIDGALSAFRVSNDATGDEAGSASRDGADSANGSGGGRRAAARDALHRLLERQHYRLASWRTASDEVNWRRFFDISSLAGMRMERGDVFDASHMMILRLYALGLIDGVRIDHVDGMAEPREYCHRLRTRLEAARAERPAALRDAPPYLVVEKILARGEPMRGDWRIDGTTGYDFMNDVGALLHDPDGAEPLAALWATLSGRPADFADEALPARRKILAENLAAELDRAARALHRLARDTPQTRDWPLTSIRRVLSELVVHYGVYRIYPIDGQRSVADEPYFAAAREAARASLRRADHALLDQIDQWLGATSASRSSGSTAPSGASDGAGQAAEGGPHDAPSARASTLARLPRADRNEEARAAQRRLALTLFSQLTSPVAAKSVEDTGCYRYGRLLSRNEVGADPDDFAMSVEDFHAANSERQQRFPYAMLTTATHDHKRGEDVRARLAVLSELPNAWANTWHRWSTLNAPHATGTAAHAPAPGPGPESMLYQTLVGCWPATLDPTDGDAVAALAERVAQWQEKALREAKLDTDWFAPDSDYEAASRAFLMTILGPDRRTDFLAELHAFVQAIAPAGVVNSLQQTVLRMTSPGVPDLYQGTDWWDWSLVDPDNRRPVDYAARADALAAMRAETAAAEATSGTSASAAGGAGVALCDTLLAGWQDGRVKQWLIHCLLALRQRAPGLYTRGDYLPLTVEGPHARSIIAFARYMPSTARAADTHGGTATPQWSITVATRLAAGLLGIDVEAPSPQNNAAHAMLPLVSAAQWEDTRIVLPEALAGMVLEDIFTRSRVIVPEAGIPQRSSNGSGAESDMGRTGEGLDPSATGDVAVAELAAQRVAAHSPAATGNASGEHTAPSNARTLSVAALLAHLPVAVLADGV